MIHDDDDDDDDDRYCFIMSPLYLSMLDSLAFCVQSR